MTNNVGVRQKQAERTRANILRAAQTMFASVGYDETGIREIAGLAGVNSSLISRYFGSKVELFAAALEESMDVTHFTGVPKERFGEGIVELVANSQAVDSYPIPMLVFAAANTQAREAALRVLKKVTTGPLERWLGGAEAANKAVQIQILVTGIFFYRFMLPQPAICGPLDTPMRKWLAHSFQEIIDS